MSRPARVLLALFLGLALGIAAASSGSTWVDDVVSIADPIGTAWLNGLRMTIVPLVTSLLITGIAATAQAARAGGLTARAVGIFFICIWASAGLAALLTPLLLDAIPLPAGSAEALRNSFAAAAPVGDVPGIAAFLGSIIPTNPISAAANDQILPLIVFTTVFAFALLRLPEGPREQLTGFFSGIADVMLVIIGWILFLAPIGVFALAFGALLHYVVVVSSVGIVIWGLAYPLGVIGGRVPLGRFSRAVGPSQAVAISTQSSLASLPTMLKSSEAAGVPTATAGVVLPLAVALFRATGPGMNLAVVIYVAWLYGMPLGPTQLLAGVAAAAITTLGAVSLPGQVSFVTSIAPISLAMGIPIEPLAILIAVETIPDIFRTVGNVTMDVAVTATVHARSGGEVIGHDAEIGSEM